MVIVVPELEGHSLETDRLESAGNFPAIEEKCFNALMLKRH